MEVYINYPKNKNEINELSKAIAKFQATLILRSVEDLKIDDASKRKVIKRLIEKTKEEEVKKNKWIL